MIGFLYPTILDPDIASVLVPFTLEIVTGRPNGFDPWGGSLKLVDVSKEARAGAKSGADAWCNGAATLNSCPFELCVWRRGRKGGMYSDKGAVV